MSDGGAWQDFASQASAVEANAQDCANACKALESLARAANHVCEVAPDHCDEAKARLAAATDKVHASCPSCDVRATTPTADGQVQAREEVYAVRGSRGGCGCEATPDTGGGALGLVLVLVIACACARRACKLRRARPL